VLISHLPLSPKDLNFMQKIEARQAQMFAMVEEFYQSKMTWQEFCNHLPWEAQ